MRKGFLLTADKKEKKRRASSRSVSDSDEQRHDEITPQANGGAGLSMKQGFLLQSSPTRRKCKQEKEVSGRESLDDGKDTTKATPPPQKRDVTSTSAALLDLEDRKTFNDDGDPSPSLINFIACSSNNHRDDEVSDSKQSPIMVEIDDGPITVIEEKTVDDVGRIDSANDDDLCSEENTATPNNDTAATEMDSFAFASQVSQLLSRLRRALKSNDHSKRKDVTNNSLNGVRQFMNQKSEKLVKAFVEKHICIDASAEQELRLQQLWRTILQQIAQESSVSNKKKNRPTYSVSSQLALGIGILEFSKPIGVALKSIASLLSSLASSIVEPNGCDEEKEKRHKIEAIGAILLVQCHFRCMSIDTSEEETAINGFDRVRIEASILLNKIIPALQSIVTSGQKRTYLSSTALDAFFELIEIIPRVQSIGFHSSIASPQDILLRIEEMIDMKRLWMTDDESAITSKKRVPSTLFYNAPFKVILPHILDYMSHRYATHSSTSISCILCNLMEASAKEHADDFVGCLITSAQQYENCKLIFEDNGENWKSILLESDNDCGYRNILLATAKSMVGMPSSAIPLSLFSSLVGMTNELDTTDSEQKVLKATVSVVQFAVNELRLPRDFDSGDEQAVFKRLSPLLILRRLPNAYYQILHTHMMSTESSFTVMHELATELANEIRAHALKNDEGNLAREEKMLLAQVAGHCLPFSVTPSDLNESPIALFDLFEKPFSATLDNMRFESKSSLDLQNINESKLALFAVCQHIPGASDDDGCGTAFVKVASFVFEFLYEYHQTTHWGEHIRQELAKLHTGCLHFLGVVFDSLFARKAKSFAEQIEPEANNCRNKFLDGLIRTFDDTSSIVFNGAIPELEGRYFSASTRISIFNAMVTYTQSCTAEDQRLALFASELLPVLIKWVDKGAIDDDIRHPLCVAASLQVVYTILAKLGSFDWVNDSETKFVRLTLRCAFKSLCNEEGAGICSPLRLVSMKVILTVIAIKQDLTEYFERDEIHRAMIVVREAVNRDESQEVRQLAFKILPYLES